MQTACRHNLIFAHFFGTYYNKPPFVTCCFTTGLSCDSTTDRQTVSTPQRHLPSIPTLTLIKNFEPSLLPGITLWLIPTNMSTTPSGVVSPDTPSGSPLLQRPLPPPARPLTPSPHLSPPLLLLHSPCLGTCHCSFNETAPYHCRGTKHESLGDLPLPYLSRGLLNVGFGYTPI